MCPCNVNSANIMTVWNNLYDKTLNSNGSAVSTPKFHVGDHVRITKYKHIFQKGYELNWSDEIFVITSIIDPSPWLVYSLKYLQDEPITGD